MLRHNDENQRKALLGKIADAREELDDGEVARATAMLDDVKSKLEDSGMAVASARPRRPRVGNLLAKLSPVETSLSLGAHLLGVVVWIGLLIVGFQALYIDQGATFGSDGIFDFVGLVLWGLSADVASRGLGNLTGGDTAEP